MSARATSVARRMPQVLPVRSLRRAVELYRDGLGLALVQQSLTSATLVMPATGERLDLYVAAGRAAAELVVEDAAAAAAAVLRKGGEVRTSLLDLPVDRRVVCVDLDGNRLELTERRRRRAA